MQESNTKPLDTIRYRQFWLLGLATCAGAMFLIMLFLSLSPMGQSFPAHPGHQDDYNHIFFTAPAAMLILLAQLVLLSRAVRDNVAVALSPRGIKISGLVFQYQFTWYDLVEVTKEEVHGRYGIIENLKFLFKNEAANIQIVRINRNHIALKTHEIDDAVQTIRDQQQTYAPLAAAANMPVKDNFYTNQNPLIKFSAKLNDHAVRWRKKWRDV